MNMSTAKTVVSTAASVAASAMVVRSIAREFVPVQLRYFIMKSISGIFKSLFGQMIKLTIEEVEGLSRNQIYIAADIYLGSKFSLSSSTQVYKVSLPEKEEKPTLSMARNQEAIDVFQGVKFKWRQVTTQVEAKQMGWVGQASIVHSETRRFELSFHKKHKDMVLESYIPFILRVSKSLKQQKKTLKLHTLDSDGVRRTRSDAWNSIKLDHPATFETLAMDLKLKETIMGDLDRFVRRREFYRRVGKAWKRGYLLYGSPGTGKSSLVAAMANYLQFDVYDLELSDIHSNSELRKVLLSTANRSILVIEDIDCGIELQDRQKEVQPPSNPLRLNRVTLSGLLNFIDGLWSSCGDERIIIFTTNHMDRLDPALLRPGRMDVHIHMSYCNPRGFTTLAANYLGLTDHSLFHEITELLPKIHVTPAEVGEQLLKTEDPNAALKGLIDFLHSKKRDIVHETPRKEKEVANVLSMV